MDSKDRDSDNDDIEKSISFATERDSNYDHPESPIYDEEYDEIALAYPLMQMNRDKTMDAASENIALQHLDELASSGLITGSEMAYYKKKFLMMNELLQRTRDNEFDLVQLGKRLQLHLDEDKSLLTQADDFPDDSNTEVSKARQTLLSLQNSNLAIEDRYELLSYKVVTLEEEKKMLENEMKRLPAIRDKELMKQLEESNEELKDEISKLVQESRSFHDTIKETKDKIRTSMDDDEIISIQLNELTAKLLEANSLPLQHSKVYEKVRKEKLEQDEILLSVESELETLVKKKKDLDDLTQEKDKIINHLKLDFNKIQNDLLDAQRKLDDMKKLFEQNKEKEVEMNLDKAKLSLDMDNLQLEKKRLHEEIIIKTRNKDNSMKDLKTANIRFVTSQDALSTTKDLLLQTQKDYDVFPKIDTYMKDSIEKRQREIEHRKRLYEAQKNFSEDEKTKLAQSTQEEERLLYDLSDLRIEVVELTRLAQIKADEREQKAKEFIQKEKRFNHVIDELKEKNLNIEDSKRKLAETQMKLTNFAKLYNVIQNERNKCANMINSVTQKGSEMREKIRILNNEIEILRTNLFQKENLVQKQRSKYMELVSIRDSLRSEISKQNVALTEQKEKRDQFQLNIQRLNQLGNFAEEAMVQLRKQNDLALQNRNDRAVQLIERNEEVCILQEKYHIKEEIIKAGDLEIQVRNDEIEYLKEAIKEQIRQIELCKKKLSGKRNLEKETVNLKIQIAICRDRLAELESKIENPEGDNRARVLKGDDLPPVEMENKLEDLHSAVTLKEEKLLEKQLLFEAVTRLVSELQKRVSGTKFDMLDLATALNDCKHQMSSLIKRLRAKTAELTMNMSESLKLQQEVKKKENILKEVYENIENDTDVDMQLDRTLIAPKTKPIDDIGPKRFELTNGTYTTAEPRPNAYIPDNEKELPIPRPYGVHAPFKPSEPGSNMRHIRKQKLKPIEI